MTCTTISPQIAEIVAEGAAMLDDVETAVHRCRTDPDPSSDLAKFCGSLVSRYLALRRRLASLPPSPFHQHLDGLLNYELEITGQASMLAFRPHDSHWAVLAEQFGDGPGAAAAELSRLARDLPPRPIDPPTTHRGHRADA